MLLGGINHVAVLTADSARFTEFYGAMFGAVSEVVQERDGFKLTMVKVGPTAELNVFELAGNTESHRQVPMFGRGRLDHLALEAASLAAFEEGAADCSPGGPRTGSSPTSGRSSACSSATPMGWRQRSASSTPRPPG